MTFYIGQKFYDSYKPEVAVWCNSNNAHLEKDGNVYIIVENPPPPKTITVRTFSKFKIWVATRELPITLADGTQAIVWDLFEQFLVDSKLRVGYEMLDVLEEDNEFFMLFYPKACEVFSKELVDTILESSVVSVKEVIKQEQGG